MYLAKVSWHDVTVTTLGDSERFKNVFEHLLAGRGELERGVDHRKRLRLRLEELESRLQLLDDRIAR